MQMVTTILSSSLSGELRGDMGKGVSYSTRLRTSLDLLRTILSESFSKYHFVGK